MSYAPIYNKLQEIENRLALVETAPKTTDDAVSGIMIGTPADTQSTDLSGVIAELNNVKADLNKLLSVSNSLLSTGNSTNNDVSAHVIDYLTAIATLATKEELATLATKEELVTLATKEELANFLAKFDNVINVISQLNVKINDAHDKISALEGS